MERKYIWDLFKHLSVPKFMSFLPYPFTQYKLNYAVTINIGVHYHHTSPVQLSLSIMTPLVFHFSEQQYQVKGVYAPLVKKRGD